MPDPTDAELGLDPEVMETLDPNIRADLRRNRQLQRDLDAAQAEINQAKREASFAKAGIPDSPVGQMFAKAYDGDTSDPAAVKAAFDALGVAAPPAPSADPPPPAAQTGDEAAREAELAEERRIAQLGNSGHNDGSVPLDEALRSATSEQELLAIVAAAPADARISTVRID